MTIAWRRTPSAKRIFAVAAVLLIALPVFGAKRVRTMPSWARVKDAYRVHQRRVVREHDGTQTVLGEFYEVETRSYVALCNPADSKTLAFFETESGAREYVLRCEVLD